MAKTITIDGPAGSGKSTVSRLLAKRLGYLYLDTGAMYRGVALQAKRKSVDLKDTGRISKICRDLNLHFKTLDGVTRLFLGQEDISSAIRSPEMDMLSSAVSAVKEVREAMTLLQRKMGEKQDLVAEGRDMGTVVFPGAEWKFFLDAEPGVRAGRRYLERRERGESVSRQDVETELRKRDDQDRTRALAPLVPAEDAIVVDTTALTAEQVVEKMLNTMKKGHKKTFKE
ncbi:MAG: (d)CMP kinase [Desulfobacterota bacterium]|nr:(d)CMP kinase [Thermodesulfobacteriota bacterium]